MQINFEINIINIRREITKYLSNNENIETTLYDEKLLKIIQLLLLIKNEMYSSLLLTSFYFLKKLTVRRYFKKSAISFQKQ